MVNQKSIWPFVIVILAVSVLVGVRSLRAEPPPPPPDHQSLVGASPEEMKRHAIAWAKESLKVAGEPVAVYAQVISPAQLPELGLTAIGYDPARPYALIVLKGDFDLSNTYPGTGGDPTTWKSRVQYVAYVFDLQVGRPALIETSAEGVEFRALLGDVVP